MTNPVIMPGKTIGIIGGGQLGRMMALAAKEKGFRIAVLDPAKDSPCGQVADVEITAAYDDQNALARLAQISDVITYEFENIDYESLRWLEQRAYLPQGAELIRITQDRILEKDAITKAGVPVAPYEVIYEENELYDKIKKLGYPAVLKTSRGGYDGKGQYVIRRESEIEKAAELLQSGPCVLEKWIPFTTEISVIVFRNPDREVSFLPVGENIHVENILHQTIVPARVDGDVKQKAVKLALKIADYLELIGTLAVEMFVCSNGEIYINELAPRPHNSGHYSIEACEASQFEQHIRAICNWPFQKTELLKPAVMVNVLGKHLEGALNEFHRHPDWSFHLYGKKEAKEKRKMGHITVLTDDLEKTLQEIDDSRIWSAKEEKIGGSIR
ncbi:5-(carboxyamino)imidazole ribonucleotide synthase [Bacillus smithii]|uniref:5-(carboxyamino)imidazole ribonucleotide synthase n=1 Tax=Bacillus smithii TaxID=1479 RepID=UPI003D1FAF72